MWIRYFKDNVVAHVAYNIALSLIDIGIAEEV